MDRPMICPYCHFEMTMCCDNRKFYAYCTACESRSPARMDKDEVERIARTMVINYHPCRMTKGNEE